MKEPAHDAGGGRLVATVTDTPDVSMIEAEVEVLEIDALPQERGDRFVARTGFDPRALAAPYRWFRISRRRIQAWREVNEMPDRELMRDGRWCGDGRPGGEPEGRPPVLRPGQPHHLGPRSQSSRSARLHRLPRQTDPLRLDDKSEDRLPGPATPSEVVPDLVEVVWRSPA